MLKNIILITGEEIVLYIVSGKSLENNNQGTEL